MLCVRGVSFKWCILTAVRSPDLRKAGSCSMSHSRASDILRRSLACGGGPEEGGRLLWRQALESPDDVVPVASPFETLFV